MSSNQSTPATTMHSSVMRMETSGSGPGETGKPGTGSVLRMRTPDSEKSSDFSPLPLDTTPQRGTIHA